MQSTRRRTTYGPILEGTLHLRLTAVAAILLVAGSLAAQSVPTGVQEYFVLGWEQHLWDMMNRVNIGEGGPAFNPDGDGTNSVVTATASADGQVIYYDHWEDGLDLALAGFPDSIGTLQGSTIVIGDGDPSNGDVCTYNANLGCGTDLLKVGDYVNFASDQGITGACAPPGGALGCSVPVNPRSASEVRFDGGDLVLTSGGPLSLIHNQWPLTQFIGGATEILPRQAVEAARSYSVPIGEDLYATGTATVPFQYVELQLVAFEDTGITVESPGAGSVSFTLGRGEHWSSMGAIDDTIQPSLELTINAGTKVSTTAPITGMIFTGGEGTWATRHFALLPDILHSTDYVLTAPGDDPAVNGDRPANIYILNPDLLSSIDVQITDSSGSYALTIPPNSMRSMEDLAPSRDIAPNSTVRITSDRNFWGITAYDYGSPSNDWGHSWLAKKFLTRAYTVGHAPQNSDIANQPELFNPVYVAATQDNTHVNFDLDNDGIYDLVDLDGDGTADPAPLAGNTYVVDTPAALFVFEPDPATSDRDMTGTRIIANKPIAVSWGQETDLAPGGSFGLDTGYTVYPVQQGFLDPALTIDKTADTPVVPLDPADPDDRIVTYTLEVRSYEIGPLTGGKVFDLLPADVTGADYVAGSTLITYPDLAQDTVEPTATLQPSGRWLLEWPLTSSPPYAPGDPPFSFGTDQTLTVEYRVRIPAVPGGPPRRMLNEGSAQATLGGSVFTPTDIETVVQTDASISKAVDTTSPAPGDVLTYTLTVANNGATDETDVTISDAIPDDTTFCDATIDPVNCADPAATSPFGAGAFDPGQNAVEWTAATLGASETAILTFRVKVNPQAKAGAKITNRGGYESAETPYFLSNPVVSTVQGPALDGAKSIVGSPSIVHPNEVVTFQIRIDNTGSAPATDVLVSDPYPVNAGYVASSIQWSLNSGPFVALSDAGDGDEGGGADGRALADRLEFRLASLGASQNVRVRYQVRVDPGTANQFLSNQATFASDQIPSTDTNLVQVPIVGDADITGHVFLDSDGKGVQDPGEPDLGGVDVLVTDATGAQQVVTTDANGDYLVTVSVVTSPVGCYRDEVDSAAYDGSNGSLDWSGDPWAEFGTGADTNPGTAPMEVVTDPQVGSNTVLRIEGSGGGSGTPRGFTRAVDIDPGVVATLSFRYFREGLEVDDIISLEVDYGSGFQLIDTFGQPPGGTQSDAAWLSASYDLDPTQLPAEPVTLRWRSSSGYNFGTDEFHLDDVELCINDLTDGDVTLDVDETDPDLPPGSLLTTGNDPQTVTASPGGTVASGDVGFRPPALIFTKSSDAVEHEVSPGQTVTYTLEITNNSGTTQTEIDIYDELPAGMTWVPESTQVTGAGASALRVTEYYLGVGAFTGTTYDLTLDQDLAADYFVIVQGSDGDGSALNARGPDENYATLTADPTGTGELAASGASDVIRLERGGAVNSWVGVVTVVECVADCPTAGFELLDVQLVDHPGSDDTGSDTSAATWSDIDRIMLMGGFNGSGCLTAETNENNTITCQARIFPSGSDQIVWTRDAGGGALSAATSTVMVVEWGSEWTVQRVRVQGDNGGDGADDAGEYNTAAISPAARAATWVWGTGHTNDNGIGDSSEGCLIALGDGALQNATETTVAVGLEYAGRAVDFEVYALTHPDLAVDQRFKADGDGTALTVDVTVDASGSERMALSTNGQNGTGNAFPRPMFSARYVADGTVRLERRRSGQAFPAWVQGIDFSGIAAGSPPGGGVPPDLVIPSDGYTIPPGGTLTVTFQVVVDDPLGVGIAQITNTATLDTEQLLDRLEASVTDDVVRAGVVVEYNNAGFDLAGAIVVYNHVVTNTGEGDDSYDITLDSKAGWAVDLVDPSTGAIIASDSDGNGSWDGGASINTGTLAAGETAEYELRVHIPGDADPGDAESTALVATSLRNPGLWDVATDETVVVDALDPIIFLPDNSGAVTAGGRVVYSHRIINNTGGPETFDLRAAREDELITWTTAFYWDSNGDGVFTDGVDIEISNTAQLPDGGSQQIFMVVDVPLGTPDYTVDVVYLTAFARSDPDNLFDTATDTTTVRPPIVLDLSGGGTRNVTGNTTAVFPGTLRNFSDAADVMNFGITAAWFFGFDGLPHPSGLWIDTGTDGIADLEIARDDNGDGSWDTILAGYDTDTDGRPDVTLDPNSELAYELRRDVHPSQGPSRDPVTLTVFSSNSGDRDSVTATNFLAAATKAVLAAFDAYAVNGRVVVEWRTAAEVGTIGFEVRRRRAGDSATALLRPALVRGVGRLQGGTYRVVDEGVAFGDTVSYVLREVDVWGTGTVFGPFEVTIAARHSSDGVAKALATGLSRTVNTSSVRTTHLGGKAAAGGTASGLVKVKVRESGMVWLSAEALASALGVTPATVSDWIADGSLAIGTGAMPVVVDDLIFANGFEDDDTMAWSYSTGSAKTGRARVLPGAVGGSKRLQTTAAETPAEVAWVAAEAASGLYFYGEAADSIYTRDNVYWLRPGSGGIMASRAAATDSAPEPGSFTENLHYEEDNWPLTAVMTDPEVDYWMWELFSPYDGEPVHTESFSLATPGAVGGPGDAVLTVKLQGSFETDISPNHLVELRLNGTQLGDTWSWDGHDVSEIVLALPQALLNDGINTLEISGLLAAGLDFDEFYLQSIDIEYERVYQARDGRLLATTDGGGELTVAGFETSDITVFDLTDPLRPVLLDQVRVSSDGDSYRVSFATGGVVFPFLAASPEGAVLPAAVEADLASDLRDPGTEGEWVVVAGAGLEAEAGLLADYRQQQGLSTVVARTADIYDEFSGGLKSPWAIRDFLQHAAVSWALPPRYVLLAGDGSMDHRGVLGEGEDLVPAPMVVTDDGLVPSDNLLADWEGNDGVPEVALGRLPVHSPAELAGYRAKLEVFEASSGAWKDNVLWLADDGDVGGFFSDDIEDLIEAMPERYNSTRISLESYDVDTAWDLALDEMVSGVVLVSFLGHGGFDRLTEEGLMVTDKAMVMGNAERTPFLSALTCVVGRFDVPWYDTLSEALLLNPSGGAVAVWAPSGYSMNVDALELGARHVEAIASGTVGTVGDSVRAALAAYAAAGTGDPTGPATFVLLGDPATRVDW